MAALTSALATLLTAGSLLVGGSHLPKCGGLGMPGYGMDPVYLVDGRVLEGQFDDLDPHTVASITVGCWNPVHGFDVSPGVPLVRVLTKNYQARHALEDHELQGHAEARELHAMRALYRSRLAGDRLAKAIPTPACLQTTGAAGSGRSFRVRSGTTELTGRLIFPDGVGPYPAVVLLPGGNAKPSRRRTTPEFMAERLSRCGFAALYFERGEPGIPGGAYGGTTFERVIAGASAAVDALRRVDGIEKEGIGVMSFSQAGHLAPLVAIRNPAVAFVVGVSGPIESVPPSTTAAVIANAFGRDRHNELDRLRVPWLSIYGGGDASVPVESSIELIHDEMFEGGNDDYAVVVIPGAGHDLHMAATGAPVPFEAIVIDWARRRLDARSQAVVPDEVRRAEVRTIELSSDGRLWFGTTGRGLGVMQNGRFDWVTGAGTPPQRGVADVHEDLTGRLWAVGPGGAHVLDDGNWAKVEWMAGIQPSVVFGASDDRTRRLTWLGTNRGAVRIHDLEWLAFTEEDGLPHPVVHDVVVDGEGETWLLTRTGVARRAGSEFEAMRQDLNFRSAVVDNEGVAWFGTNNGAYRYLDGEWVGELQGFIVYPKLVSSDGAVWAGSSASGIFRRHAGEWSRIELPPRFEGVEIFDLAQTPDGAIWVATAVGVFRIPPDSTD